MIHYGIPASAPGRLAIPTVFIPVPEVQFAFLQDAEKIYILREELEAKGAKSKLKRLNEVVGRFTPEGLVETQQDPTEMVQELNQLLNEL